MSGMKPTESPSHRLKLVLQHLKANPSPRLENPPGCPKRASVALILRFRPRPQQKATFDSDKCSSALPFDQCLDAFFHADWVKEGVPEVLFIKRAARVGDRWTSHVALPGGKRDLDDDSDFATSVRETMEETGIMLENDDCLGIGKLPERVITAAWGKQPLMVLCPFVFLLLRYDTPPLDLQAAEVGSAHWVPLYSLLSPPLRTYQTTDISDRISPRQGPYAKRLWRLFGGKMIFRATRLISSESRYSVASEAISTTSSPSIKYTNDNEQPLLLWGLTLGIMADFLRNIDAEATETLWSWPTFTHWDIRFVVWLLTRSLRHQRQHQQDAERERLGGADATTYTTNPPGERGQLSGLAGAQLLDEYFQRMKSAVALAAGVRLGVSLAIITWLLRRRRGPG